MMVFSVSVFVGCSVDTTGALSEGRDCRNDQIGCNDGFQCRLNTNGWYECLEPVILDGGVMTPDAQQVEVSCDDGLANGDETDADCGGSCEAPCGEGSMCENNDDCSTGICSMSRCVPISCVDGFLNGAESGVDCGGDCDPCDEGIARNIAPDCSSGVCLDMICQSASCNDFIQNGDERLLDCGGSCAGCADGNGCVGAEDCVSGVCTNGICQVPTCSDGVQNGLETDVDCDGDCVRCDDDLVFAPPNGGRYHVNAVKVDTDKVVLFIGLGNTIDMYLFRRFGSSMNVVSSIALNQPMLDPGNDQAIHLTGAFGPDHFFAVFVEPGWTKTIRFFRIDGEQIIILPSTMASPGGFLSGHPIDDTRYLFGYRPGDSGTQLSYRVLLRTNN